MPNTFIPFDGWQPAGSQFGDGWGTVLNAYPAYSDWRPWRKFVPLAGVQTGGGGGFCAGAHVHTWNSGTGNSGSYTPDAQTLFTGNSQSLFTVDPTTGNFTDVSRAGVYGSQTGWRFASIGNDIWAANWTHPMQRRTNNAGNFADGVVSTFKPTPRFLGPFREHMMVANLSDAGRFQDEIAVSDADDATNFDPATGVSTSLATSKRLVAIPGQITGLVGGQYALVFKRKGIFYLEYTGDVQVFRPDVLSPNVGTMVPASIINSRYGIFFIGPDGFYKIQGLSEPVKISPPGIDRFLLDSNFTVNAGVAFSKYEDFQAVGFQFAGWPLIGWALHFDWVQPPLLYGSDIAILYNPVTDQWSNVTIAAPGNSQQRVTSVFSRPNAATLYESVAALTWDGVSNRCAPFSPSGANVWPPTLGMNFRPANFDTKTWEGGQSRIKSFLPVFSSVSGVGGASLTESVTIEALLDPGAGLWKTETRVAADRNSVSGAYPFQIAGCFFRITINCAAEDFANFEGAFVDQELLS